jgi:hypothetical protein
VGQCVPLGLAPQVEAATLHPAEQTTLLARCLPQQSGKVGAVPGQGRPVRALPDVLIITYGVMVDRRMPIGDSVPLLVYRRNTVRSMPVCDRQLISAILSFMVVLNT